mmetsp:Transcript_81752/g.243805  ORF Transcript_81752/g.243805 Transcript_81752/m.243805 type:complete len:202 (-) Transcript_81752:397-1002(-)
MPSKKSLPPLPSTAPWTSQLKAFLPQRPSTLSSFSSSSPFFCAAVRVTSTKGTKTTGARKRRPTTQGKFFAPPRPAGSAASATAFCNRTRGSDSVLVARSTPGGAARRASESTPVLMPVVSGTASMTMSAPRTASAMEAHHRASRGSSPSYGAQGPPLSGGRVIPASSNRPWRLHICTTSVTRLLIAAWPSCDPRSARLRS